MKGMEKFIAPHGVISFASEVCRANLKTLGLRLGNQICGNFHKLESLAIECSPNYPIDHL
jgi:hypothetical protein